MEYRRACGNTGAVSKSVARVGLRLCALVALAWAGAVGAEEAEEADDEAQDKPEEVVVTGTRLRDVISGVPIVVINREDMLLQGLGSVEDLVRSLPQNFSDVNAAATLDNSMNSVDAIGQSGVDLRNLGEGSTLVLVNGRRWVQSSTFGNGAVNLNGIPFNAIERVEVLTDGASAIYGADAQAGVINFILRDDFSGAETSLRQDIGANEGNILKIEQTAGVSCRRHPAGFAGLRAQGPGGSAQSRAHLQRLSPARRHGDGSDAPWREKTFSNTSPKLDAVWRPFESFKVRASWGESFVPPQTNRLFGQDSGPFNFIRVIDPEDPDAGLQFPDAYFTGNSDLVPEVSRNVSAGFDWTPSGVMDGFDLQVTLTDIDIRDRIGSITGIAFSTPEQLFDLPGVVERGPDGAISRLNIKSLTSPRARAARWTPRQATFSTPSRAPSRSAWKAPTRTFCAKWRCPDRRQPTSTARPPGPNA